MEEEREVFPRILQNINTGTKRPKVAEDPKAMNEEISKSFRMIKEHLIPGEHDNIVWFDG